MELLSLMVGTFGGGVWAKEVIHWTATAPELVLMNFSTHQHFQFLLFFSYHSAEIVWLLRIFGVVSGIIIPTTSTSFSTLLKPLFDKFTNLCLKFHIKSGSNLWPYYWGIHSTIYTPGLTGWGRVMKSMFSVKLLLLLLLYQFTTRFLSSTQRYHNSHTTHEDHNPPPQLFISSRGWRQFTKLCIRLSLHRRNGLSSPVPMIPHLPK